MQHEMCLTESKSYFQHGLANLRLGYVGQAKQDFENALEGLLKLYGITKEAEKTAKIQKN